VKLIVKIGSAEFTSDGELRSPNEGTVTRPGAVPLPFLGRAQQLPQPEVRRAFSQHKIKVRMLIISVHHLRVG
jgi:hypothetical protein